LQGSGEAPAQEPGLARVRGSVDQVQRHRSKRSSIGRPPAIQPSLCRLPPPLDCTQLMALCFVDPADAIRAIADSIGREARRRLLAAALAAEARGRRSAGRSPSWVAEFPAGDLEAPSAKPPSGLDEPAPSLFAPGPGPLEIAQPAPTRAFLRGAFGSFGENR